MKAHVRLRLFSGWPDYQWTLDDTATRKVLSYFVSLPPALRDKIRPKPRLGYHGFTMTLVKETTATASTIDVFNGTVQERRTDRVMSDPKRGFEEFIFQTAPPTVIEALGSMSYAMLSGQGPETAIAGLNPPDSAKAGCPNAPTLPSMKDWKTHADYNNCYNYANDVLNVDEWSEAALPGTLKKMPASTVTTIVKGILRNQILTDGLTRVAGDKVPTVCPALNKHYLAVIIRHHPNSTVVHDFHCLRLDQNGTWSHKDGSGEVRTTDDSGAYGNVITDLTQARFDGNPVLVGIYRAKKNNTKIS